MISKEEAFSYSEQLHPAFAGYLVDGSITERDALATIMQLISKGNIYPIWEDNSMTKALSKLRSTNKKCKFPFEKLILDVVFQSNEFDNSVVPLVKTKYTELYNFIESFPLTPLMYLQMSF